MVISVDYKEGEGQDTYEAVSVYLGDDKEDKKFATGDFIADFNEALEWVTENNDQPMILMSSTVDTFLEEKPQYYYIDSHGMGVNDGKSNE